MAITKSSIGVTDWTAVAQNVIGESAEIDLSDVYEALIHIHAFLDTETPHTGTKFIVQISGSATGDEDWEDFAEFVELIGTANTEPITNNPLTAGSTTITCASTTGYVVEGEWRAIKDGTLANSELILQTAYSATPDITILDGTTNEHAQTTAMYNIAFTKNILLPSSAYRARVVVDNTYDNDGSTLNYKVRLTKVTAV
jgi:hypothetical protein